MIDRARANRLASGVAWQVRAMGRFAWKGGLRADPENRAA
jgi:hypothetical protein